MASIVQLKKSSVAGKIPLASDLSFGELALNYADGKLYYKKTDGTTIDSFQAGSGSSSGTRVITVADSTSITMNSDTTDVAVQINTQAAGTLTLNAPSGTPTDGQKLMLRLQATNAQTFSFNAIFEGSTDLPLPATSSSGSKYDYLGFMYNSAATQWQLIAKNFGF